MITQTIKEWRGVKGLVAAEVLTDDNGTSGYTTGEVFDIAGVAELSRTRDVTNEAHYYNDIPAVVISGESPDTVTVSVSAIPLDVFAKITGQVYDNATGMLIEGQRTPKYYAIGYITENTAGEEIYVWRLKGMFNIPDQDNSTIDDGTDANGQELIYTGVETVHKFTKTGKGARAVNVETAKELVDTANFFASVQTPDTITASGNYVLGMHTTGGCTLAVSRLGTQLTNGAAVQTGQILVIEWTHPDDANTYECEYIHGGMTDEIPYPSGSITVGTSNVTISAHIVT